MACLVMAAALVPVAGRASADPGLPSALQFEATSDGATVQLNWAGPPGIVVGFNVLRARKPDGPYAPINPWLIPAGPSGAYAFSDLAVDPGATYHYQLEAVDAGGRKYLRGPLSISVMPEESRILSSPDGGGYPASGPKAAGAAPGGGCAAGDGRRWPDAAGLILLLALALLRWGRRAGRFSYRSPMG